MARVFTCRAADGHRGDTAASHRLRFLVRRAPAKPKIIEPNLPTATLDCEPDPTASRPGLLITADTLIESVDDILKGQPALEQHCGWTCTGIAVRVVQRILGITAALWHNHMVSAPLTVADRVRPRDTSELLV